ncbi:MAG: hypothetical protein KC561_19780, partial [Myxococcales bacterium]|nr:hypothetical protein [Myxococcales bacterium]
MEPINKNVWMTRAEQMGQVYPCKPGWVKSQVFAGVLCCILILTIPLGIWIIIAARKAKLGLTEEGFVFKGIGSSACRWSDIETLSIGNQSAHVTGGGLVGALAAAAVNSAIQK